MSRACRPDHGREAVYAAEDMAFGGTDLAVPDSWAALRALAARVLTGSWWQSTGAPPVDVLAARAGARSSTARSTAAGAVVVRLAEEQMTASTLAHELAHALAGVDAGHGPPFRSAAVDVIAVVAGAAHADSLRRAYLDMDLIIDGRRWPPPNRGVGDQFVILP